MHTPLWSLSSQICPSEQCLRQPGPSESYLSVPHPQPHASNPPTLECVPQSPESTLTSPTAHCQPAEPTGSSVSPTPFLLHFPRGPHTPSALPYPPACTSTQSSHSCTHIPLACPQAPAHSFIGSHPLLPPPSSHEVTHAWPPYPPHPSYLSSAEPSSVHSAPQSVLPTCFGPSYTDSCTLLLHRLEMQILA